MLKIFIILALLCIIISLASGMVFLIKDRGKTNRTAKALTFRIILSLVLFIGVIIAIIYGGLTPNPSPFMLSS